MKYEKRIKEYRQQLFSASWILAQLSFRSKFSLNRKLQGYELPAIAKQQNGICWQAQKKRLKKNLDFLKLSIIINIKKEKQNENWN